MSACLLGEKVRYDGGHQAQKHAVLQQWLREGRVVGVCPEVLGGLPVPRAPAEIEAGIGGVAVMQGRARVLTRSGKDVTAAFQRGAQRVQALCKQHGAVLAVLKEGSPSCGSGRTYDGAFSGTSVKAPGVTTAVLQAHNIAVFSETEWDQAAAYLMQREHAHSRNS